MKKIVLSFSFLVLVSIGFSQVLFSEDFNYAAGVAGDSIGGGPGTTTALGDTIWKKHSGTATGGKCIKYTPTSLVFPGFAGSGIGGAATFQHTIGSADINARIGNYDSSFGTVYTAFMLKVDSVTGKDTTCDYFFNYCDLNGAVSLSNFRGRLFLSPGSDSTQFFKIGVSKGTVAKPAAGVNSPMFTPTQFNLRQTYLVIVKYTFNGSSSDKNDEIKLFVLPGAIPVVEPAANVTFTDINQSDLKQIRSICLRQGSIGRAFATIDGIRVFKTWDAATVTLLPTKLNSFTATSLSNMVNLNWSTPATQNNGNFIVERSIDGINFNEINNVKNANSIAAEANYFIADKNIPQNTKSLYYRLKMVLANGNFEYSATQKVTLRNVKFSFGENPANNHLVLNATTNISSVNVFDISGKRVVSISNVASNNCKINTSTLVNGTYIVKAICDGETFTNNIVVAH
jgi:Secretion system C-terminal sorting domain